MQQRFKLDTTSLIVAILFLVVFFWLLSKIVSGIYTILMYASPALLILALVLNYSSVINFGKWLIQLTKRDPLKGLGAIAIAVILFPLTFAYLAIRAFFSKKVKELKKQYDAQYEQSKGEFVEFEDVTERTMELPPVPPRPRPQPKSKKTDYDDLFEDI